MLLHALAVSVALLLVAAVEMPVKTEPFRWQVAVVEAPAPQAEETVPPQAAMPAPAAPKPVTKSVEVKPASETPQTVYQASSQEVAQAVQAVVREMVASRQEAMTSQRETMTYQEAVAEQPAIRSMPSIHETARPVSALSSQRESKIVQESVQPTHMSSGIVHRVVQRRPIRSLPQTQADYGWLADAIWQRVDQYKRYPALAKANHWEGRVVLEIVVRSDGSITDLHVTESSGYEILDHNAVAVVQKASPLALKHPLGQPQVRIHVPITYKLDG